ncbi:MAG: DEAD/DEAH box helicase, partial [Elusimicrobia bacterium]|nr:DEAD/DEAH box helicase [Elusimicrobiota bacterium]
IKGKWVEVDKEKLQKTLQAYEQAQKMMDEGNLTLKEAMRLQLNSGKEMELSDGETAINITNGQWLQSVFSKLTNPKLINSIKPGKYFKANLRSYQQEGLNWLYFLHSLQFGACLADDMGLGKTVQLLALINALKTKKQNKASLLVIPASIIANWINEINRFAPAIRFFAAHPSEHNKEKYNDKIENLNKNNKSLNRLDLVITTYAFVQRYKWIKSYKWNYIILDEAQAIKNPGTKQTRAVKLLKANNRIALTGTPIENKLFDLWSLFDFLNPGLLGSANEFNAFSKKLRKNADGYTRLKKIIRPYILRRLKTDKSVISDLPEKIEMKIYSELSKKQIVLYADLVKNLETILGENPDGIKRKGIILSSLMKFKQICNHPDQYLGGDEYSEKHSGKFARLREICETIAEKHEKVLIFTQFKEIIPALKQFLETIFQREGLQLHGATPVKKRKDIIERFQSHEYTPFIILSLKAGGVGLNLTAANHVIHFDRWWNPAVENQATDRAFRIGQKRNVVVHKFITRGTIEEKIDTMLEEKAGLSREIIQSSGESWITEMDNKKLSDFFRLAL